MKIKRPLGDTVVPLAGLLALAAVTIPAVTWLLCKMGHSPVLKKVLEEMK